MLTSSHIRLYTGDDPLLTYPLSFMQVPITTWYCEHNDTELLDLIPFFEALEKADDVVTFLAQNKPPNMQ